MPARTLLAFSLAPDLPLYPMPVLVVDWCQSVATTTSTVVRRNHSTLATYEGKPIGWYRRCSPEEDPR